MDHELDVILTLTGGLAAALILGLGARAMKLSPVVGYLLAGIVVGPFTPGFVAHGGIAQQLAEVGVILLMFGVGLEFHVEQLLAVRKVVVPGALLQFVVSGAAGAAMARVLGFPLVSAIVFGAAIALASTVVALRVLAEHDVLQTPAGHTTVGWLVMGDVIAVIALVVLPLVAPDRAGGDSGGGKLVGIALAMGKLALLVAFTLIVGKKLLPRFLAYVARLRSRELFTLAVLAIALGIAVAASVLFGASMALGALLAGLVVGRSAFGARAASEALPMRDAFAVLFFVSTGMLLDPRAIPRHLPLVGGTLVVVLVVTPLTAYALARLFGAPGRIAATAAGALAQIGEFSFILAALGVRLGFLEARASQALALASLVSIGASPFVFRFVRRLGDRPSSAIERDAAIADPLEDENRVIVVGYGPVGRTLVRILRDHGLAPVVLDLNADTVAALRREGVPSLVGDASQGAILERAGVKHAVGLVVSASGSHAETVRAAKELNPAIEVLARATYVSDLPALRAAGVDHAIAAEAAVAMAMAEHVLERLGATADQLDRARDEVRAMIEPHDVTTKSGAGAAEPRA